MAEHRDTHPHSADTQLGTKLDRKQRPDGNGSMSDGSMANIGNHFPSMVQNSPVGSMFVIPPFVVQCGCGAWTHYDGRADVFTALCCGASLSKNVLPDPVPCSCHNVSK